MPKKAGVTVIENDKKELVQTRLPTKIRVCIDYRKLNAATCKDHFPLSFRDQMLERLAGHEYYYFLDGYSGYNQIPIAPRIKTRLLSPVPFEHLHKEEYPSAYAMPPQRFNFACLVFFLTWFWRFSWMISLFMAIPLNNACTILSWFYNDAWRKLDTQLREVSLYSQARNCPRVQSFKQRN